LDTNVLIAALRSRRGASFELLRLVGHESWRLHLSTALLLEYEAVARREAQHLWLHPSRIEDVLDFLAANGQEHAVSFRWRPFLNDPDDDFILELAVAAMRVIL
jgi:predicted nucleic acid-binding protein